MHNASPRPDTSSDTIDLHFNETQDTLYLCTWKAFQRTTHQVAQSLETPSSFAFPFHKNNIDLRYFHADPILMQYVLVIF